MIKTRKWLVAPVVLLLIGALFFSTVIVSADPATTVVIQPASKVVGIGETFTVDVFVTPDTQIAGVQFSLNFSPSVVTANTVTEGILLKQGGASTFFQAGTINNGAGTISNVASAIITPAASVSGSGILATISFTAGSAAGTSALHLSGVIVGNKNGQAVSSTTTDGSVTVAADWDVNLDLAVNVLDMTVVGQHWGETNATPHWIRADVNRDGAINVLDMILIGQHWT
jgi:hypothetical protein